MSPSFAKAGNASDRRSSLLRRALETQQDSILGADQGSDVGPSKLNKSFSGADIHSECSSPLSRRSSGSFDFKRRGSVGSDAFSKLAANKVDSEKLEEIIREVEKLKGK